MNIAILGFDVEGKSSYDYFLSQGHTITICDQNPDLVVPAGANAVLGDNYLDNLDQFDLLVRTAGLPPRAILDKNPTVSDKITTQLNEFLRVCPSKQLIGVTGTKGKGTTATLITKMLEATGKTVYLGGNIGVPLLSLLPRVSQDSWVVLELSSFQLIDLKRPAPEIAVCLMVVPEHLNWHSDVSEYVAAKSELFIHQSNEDVAIYFGSNDLSTQIASTSPGRKLPYFQLPGAVVDNGNIVINGQTICQTSELKLLGEHNWQNVCAAVTASWQVTQDASALRSVLTTFSGLEHRLEFVRQISGVGYYDDSFGTTPETAIVAIKAFAGPKVVILGGSDKGSSYDELARTVNGSDVRKVILIGEQAGRIQQALESVGFSDFMSGGSTMTDIVKLARDLAQPGDVVLLSTACASLDMFLNYKDRGEQFKRAVLELP